MIRRWLRLEELKFDWEVVIVTIVSTLLLMVDYYHTFTPLKIVDRAILYFFIPLLCIAIVFRKHPKDYGLTLGDWKAGLLITTAAVAVMAPIIYLLGTANASMQGYYGWQMNPTAFEYTFLDLIGWEFFFRGFILFSYARVFGPHALWLQAVPFALAHNGKPEVETLTTIFGGFAFGWIAWRTKSFLYPFLIHWFIATFIIVAASGVLG